MDVILLENVATFKYRGANLNEKAYLIKKFASELLQKNTPTMVLIGIIWNNKYIAFRIKKYI